jgi:DNA modification methylase
MQIEKIQLTNINPAVYNPRKDLQPGDAEYEKLKKSITKFELVEPLVWNRKTSNLVGGHQRLKILQELGYTEVDVSVVELNDQDEKALNLALNKISGEWDETKLSMLLGELASLPDFDIELTGFDKDEVSSHVQSDIEDDNFDVDLAVEDIDEPTTKKGDIITLGRHRLMCGDSTSEEDVLKLMADAKADMVFTDPPYNVSYGESKNPKYTAHLSGKHRLIKNDTQTKEQWIEFNKKLINNLKCVCIGDMYIWGAPGPDGMRARLTYIDEGAHWSATIIWNKNRLVLAAGKYQRIYEPCFYGWFGKSGFKGDRKQVEVWEIDRPTKSELHPTMKPIELCAVGIMNSSLHGQTVLDLFLGSGSTLIAAEQTGRICYGMEIDPIYCDVIIKRWEEFTGQSAIRHKK